MALSFSPDRVFLPELPSPQSEEARTAALARKFRPAGPAEGGKSSARGVGAGAGVLARLFGLRAAWRAPRPSAPEHGQPLSLTEGGKHPPPSPSLREQFGDYAAAARAELNRMVGEAEDLSLEPVDWPGELAARLRPDAAAPPDVGKDGAAESGAQPLHRRLGDALAAAVPRDTSDAFVSLSDAAKATNGLSSPVRISAATLPGSLLRSDAMRQASQSPFRFAPPAVAERPRGK